LILGTVTLKKQWMRVRFAFNSPLAGCSLKKYFITRLEFNYNP
jgi:hypothetical protein